MYPRLRRRSLYVHASRHPSTQNIEGAEKNAQKREELGQHLQCRPLLGRKTDHSHPQTPGPSKPSARTTSPTAPAARHNKKRKKITDTNKKSEEDRSEEISVQYLKTWRHCSAAYGTGEQADPVNTTTTYEQYISSLLDEKGVFYARHRIPPGRALETSRPTPLIPSLDDIVKDFRVRVRDGVDEADAVLLLVQPGLVDQGEDGAEGGRGGRGAVDLGEGAVHGDDVVGPLMIEPARDSPPSCTGP
ncbi:hypothetical protein KC322_g91 [Hortaea werneckii]|nr:hypothetical protein KC322_g91 [Hortaea werneckii]